MNDEGSMWINVKEWIEGKNARIATLEAENRRLSLELITAHGEAQSRLEERDAAVVTKNNAIHWNARLCDDLHAERLAVSALTEQLERKQKAIDAALSNEKILYGCSVTADILCREATPGDGHKVDPAFKRSLDDASKIVTEWPQWKRDAAGTVTQPEQGESPCYGMIDAVRSLHSEVDCRIEHGADSNGHLEYVRARLADMTRKADTRSVAVPNPDTKCDTVSGSESDGTKALRLVARLAECVRATYDEGCTTTVLDAIITEARGGAA